MIIKRTWLFIILLYNISLAQQIDSTQLNHYIKKIVQEEVNKELLKIKDSSTESKKWFGERIKFSGTGLFRLGEWDMHQNSINPATGVIEKAHTRFWSRYNFYFNIDAKLTSNLDVHARIRTGNKQYSFITFGENTDERFNIILDEFWLNWNPSGYIVRLGRQDAGRIWSNQKGVQFDIPTHDGLTVVKDYVFSDIKLTPKFAYFVEYYRNNTSYKRQGKVYGAAISLSKNTVNNFWKVESGIIKSEQLPNRYINDLAYSPSGIGYHDGDLAPFYSIWTNQVVYTFKEIRNLTFKVDYYHNFKNYKKNPISNMIYDRSGKNSFDNPTQYDNATAPNFTKQNQGVVVSIATGNLSIPKNIWIEVSYLYMEKYAAMDYFAQYDYARWASTNIKGPEFSAGYRINKFLQTKMRYFVTQEIKGLDGINPDYRRAANRFRFDLNINF